MKIELLRAEKIKKTYDCREVLTDAWIHVEKGQIVGVAGLDGAGRTTLMRIIAGVEKMDSGNFYFQGKSIDTNNMALLNNKVAYITAENKLVDSLSIIDNLFVTNRTPSYSFVVNYKDIKDKCKKILCDIHVNRHINKKCSILEDNEKQRVAIVKEILKGAELIILDCTENVYSKQDILFLNELMQQSKKNGTSYIFVSNELEYLMQLSEVMFVLRGGRTVKEIRKGDYVKARIYSLMSGYKIDDRLHRIRNNLQIGEEVLRFVNVNKGMLKNIDMQVNKREIVGILSLSNRWTDELMNILLGNENITDGSIYRNKIKVNQRYLFNRGSLKNKSCIIPSPNLKSELYDNLTTWQNYILLAYQKVSFLSLGRINRKIEKYFNYISEDEIGFSKDIFSKSVAELSSKERFELIMGRIYIYKPDLMVLVSPIEVADIFLKKSVINILSRMAESGIGILIIGKNYEELTALCDRILVQNNGTFVKNIGYDEFSDIAIDDFLN